MNLKTMIYLASICDNAGVLFASLAITASIVFVLAVGYICMLYLNDDSLKESHSIWVMISSFIFGGFFGLLFIFTPKKEVIYKMAAVDGIEKARLNANGDVIINGVVLQSARPDAAKDTTLSQHR